MRGLLLDRMIAGADAGEFEFLIVSRLDRLGRNNRNLHNLLHQLEGAGVKFVCLSPDIDTSTTNGKLLLGVMATIAEHESNTTAERIKPILKSSAEKGKHHARPPFGYESKEKKLVPNTEQARIVKRLFKEKTAGASQRAMAAKLNAEGVTTATGSKWDPSNIGKLLKNRTYIGQIESDGQVFEGQHKAIVSDELWRAVEGLRVANKASVGNGRGRLPAKHLFVRGHLRCGRCGAAMVPRTKNGNAYYQCQTRKSLGAQACEMRNVPRKPVDESAWAYFASVGIDADATRERELEAINAQAAETAARLKAARKALKDAEVNLKRVKDQFKSGAITAKEWRFDFRPELEQEIVEAKARVDDLEVAQAAPPPDAKGQEVVLQRLAEIRQAVSGSLDSDANIEAARAAVRRMFDSFTIGPDEPSSLTPTEALVAQAQAAEFLDEPPALEIADKARRWVVIPEPKLELIEGEGSEIGWRPVLKPEPLPLGDNGSVTVLLSTGYPVVARLAGTQRLEHAFPDERKGSWRPVAWSLRRFGVPQSR